MKRKRPKQWNVHKPTESGSCWSKLKGRISGFCYKKARPGKLTCWFHGERESQAKELKTLLEAEEHQIATTCFHCGDPAMPHTHGFDPRCERHHDV